jgi:uncharacterized protein YbjT (DUF2867 family)
MRVLVAGATGYLGQHITRELKRRGHHVRALARNRAKLEALGGAVDEVFTADATDKGALVGCCTGVDAVVSAVGLVGKAGRQTCWEVDRDANRNLLEEAGRAGVGRFIYSSVVRNPALEKLDLVRAKRAFEQDLRRSGIAYTIVYPNGFFSDFDEYLAMARKGRIYVFGKGEFRINPIDGADVATAIADALTGEVEEVELGGPEVFTHEQIAAETFAAIGATPRITRIPAGLLKAGLVVMRRLTPLRVHGVMEFPLTVLTHDVLAPAVGSSRLSDYLRQSTEV